MRITGTWNPAEVDEEATKTGIRSVIAAYEAGYTLFDHADIYCRGKCEEVHGKAMTELPEMREKILIATKCGIRFEGDPEPGSPHRYDFSEEHIIQSCEQSLRRLGVDRIDIYQLHRPDFLCNPEEVAEAFAQLRDQGKVREFGVSNFRPSLVSALQEACPMPLVVNQIEIHPGKLDVFTDGTLDQCLERGITPLAWSPVCGGMFAEGWQPEEFRDDREHLQGLVDTLDAVADDHGVAREIVTLAWLMKHPSGIIPIVGTTDPERIRGWTAADDLELTREEWYRILTAARGKPLE
jgi:predicted oxidoreductase